MKSIFVLLIALTETASTTAQQPVERGQEYASRAIELLEQERLDIGTATELYTELKLKEREIFLNEWKKRVAPKGLGLEIYVSLSKMAKHHRKPIIKDEEKTQGDPMSVRKPSRKPMPVKSPSAAPRLDLKARLPPAVVPDLNELRRGSRLHAFGATLILSGTLSLVGGAAGVTAALLGSKVNPVAYVFPLVTGVILEAIGIPLLMYGDRHFR